MGYTPVSEKEVSTIKLLLSKDFSISDICQITGRSATTVDRVISGKFDSKFVTKQKQTDDELKSLIAKNFDLLVEIEKRLSKR